MTGAREGSMAGEAPWLRWFEEFPSCSQCRKPSAGILRGGRNESYGHHCKRCAERRLKASEKARAALRRASEGG